MQSRMPEKAVEASDREPERSDGVNPAAVVIAVGGTLYGTTFGDDRTAPEMSIP
jgi:hypothetical protein